MALMSMELYQIPEIRAVRSLERKKDQRKKRDPERRNALLCRRFITRKGNPSALRLF